MRNLRAPVPVPSAHGRHCRSLSPKDEPRIQQRGCSLSERDVDNVAAHDSPPLTPRLRVSILPTTTENKRGDAETTVANHQSFFGFGLGFESDLLSDFVSDFFSLFGSLAFLSSLAAFLYPSLR